MATGSLCRAALQEGRLQVLSIHQLPMTCHLVQWFLRYAQYSMFPIYKYEHLSWSDIKLYGNKPGGCKRLMSHFYKCHQLWKWLRCLYARASTETRSGLLSHKIKKPEFRAIHRVVMPFFQKCGWNLWCNSKVRHVNWNWKSNILTRQNFRCGYPSQMLLNNWLILKNTQDTLSSLHPLSILMPISSTENVFETIHWQKLICNISTGCLPVAVDRTETEYTIQTFKHFSWASDSWSKVTDILRKVG